MRTNSTYRTKDAVAVVLLGSAIITISLFFVYICKNLLIMLSQGLFLILCL